MKFKIGLIIFIFILVLYNYYEISSLKINRLEIQSHKLLKNIRIVQISDYHSSKFIDLKKLVLKIGLESPDILVLTGDIIDGRDEDLSRGLLLVDELKSLGRDIYFVIGNHEYRNKQFTKFINELEARQVKVLDNDIVELENYNISLGGINFGISKEDYTSLTSNMNSDHYNILLSHSPKYPLDYSTGSEDLVISGHTHGGQVRLPFIGAILSPDEGFFPTYDKGLFEIGETKFYIDSGLGTTMLPIRTCNRAGISIIEINN